MNLIHDSNRNPVLGGVSSSDSSIVLPLKVNPVTGRLLVSMSGGGGGSGDVAGPASATDNAIARFDGTTGKLIQNSAATIADTTGDITAGKYNGLTITSSTGTITITNAKTLSVSNTLTFTGTDSSSIAFGTGGTVAYTSNKLSAFAATTSAELAGVISDETGSGALVFGTAPTFTTSISTPSIISTGAIGITPASGSNLNITLATTGDLAVNTNQLYVDTSSGNIGIGTSTPAYPLTIITSFTPATYSNDFVVLNSGLTSGNDVTFRFGKANSSQSAGYIGYRYDTTASNQLVYFGTLGRTADMALNGAGNVGIGTTSPTAVLHLKAGTATAGTAPLKLTSGTALSAVEDGALEYHSSHLYFSIGSTRYQLDQQSGGGASFLAMQIFN